MPSWPARYLDGVTAHTEDVTVTPAAYGLEIRRASGIVVWPYAQITQTQGHYHGEQVRLERGTEPVEALVVDDAAFLSSLHKAAPRASHRFHDPTFRVRRPALVGFALVAAITLSAGIYFWGIPAAATLAAEQVPVSWEEQLGETVAESLIGSTPACENKEVQAAVDDMAARLAQTIPDNPYTFRVSIVRHDMMNAFAAPGGHIVVFSGLLRRTDHAEELAGVIAHEISHVVRRHGTKALFRDVATSIFLSAVIGDAGGAMGTVLESAKTLGGLHYSRKAEEEADLDGLKMLMAARIDPAGMVRFFEKLSDKELKIDGEFLRYISTHPLTVDRIAALQAAQIGKGSAYLRLPSDKNWKALASSCNADDIDGSAGSVSAER